MAPAGTNSANTQALTSVRSSIMSPSRPIIFFENSGLLK
jgi:hypothetical protein